MDAKDKGIKELIPDPEILIMGLRDTGYNTDTALADVVDNSIDADASRIAIAIKQKIDKTPIVTIADNGCGMTIEELIDGMKYGSSDTRKKKKERLGKFGLGLKTASTAFCRRLSVISKAHKEDPFVMATWDLDVVARDNKWNLMLTEEEKISKSYLDIIKNITDDTGHGTLVVWDNVDRFSANSIINKKNLDAISSSFEKYASMVYHRFLDFDDSRARNIEMTLNGNRIKAWDPFCLSEMDDGSDDGTILHNKTNKDCEIIYENGETGKASFHLRAYVVPNKGHYHTIEAENNARLTNQYSGFYVYRENRMIAGGDWLGLYRIEPHYLLCRIEFDFDHTLDVAFKVDVKKSRITLNPELADWLSRWVSPTRNCANERYRQRENKIISRNASDYHVVPDNAISKKEKDVIISEIKPMGDEKDGMMEVAVRNDENPYHPVVVSIKVAPDDIPGVNIKLKDMSDGSLWVPSFQAGHHCTIINLNHPFYKKVYYPNHKAGIAMQGLDFLIWALTEAEMGTINDNQKNQFASFRRKASEILTGLVQELPDPDID